MPEHSTPAFGPSDDLRGARFDRVPLTGARFVSSGLSDVVLRGVDVQGMDIDAPWLFEGGGVLLLNGVDVVPLVDAELDRRFPGRAERRATTPDGLRSAWAAVERAWAAAVDHAATLPAGTTDVSVGGEWSFAQTLRHLVMATDTWLNRAVLRHAEPYHPAGLANAGAEEDGLDPSAFTTDPVPYAEVLAVRAGRIAMVRDFLSAVTEADLAQQRENPWAPGHAETVLSCLHTILQEEWDHLRYATRDLAAIEAATA
ncbi:DinB family protein [Lentzea sp. NPDC060358]|uniref:DinB family protein n=1 Tax=Lentzea sp. NPDC060358 TaxID=3347103 RepID=UPI0036637132